MLGIKSSLRTSYRDISKAGALLRRRAEKEPSAHGGVSVLPLGIPPVGPQAQGVTRDAGGPPVTRRPHSLGAGSTTRRALLSAPGQSSPGRKAVALRQARKLPSKMAFTERFSLVDQLRLLCICILLSKQNRWQPRLHMHLKRQKVLKTPVFLIRVRGCRRSYPWAPSLGWLSSKRKQRASVGDDAENSEPLCFAAGDVKWCHHLAKGLGDVSKHKAQSYHMIQEFHFWVCI